MLPILFGAIIAYLTSLYSCVSDMFRNYGYYGLVYVININTHVLLFFNIISSFYSCCSEPRVVSRYLPIVGALRTASSYIKENNTMYQKLIAIAWKYWYYCLIFRIFMLNFCNTIFHTYILLFYCVDFHFRFFYYKSLIISIIKNKQTLICYCNAYLSVFFFRNVKIEYSYVNVL